MYRFVLACAIATTCFAQPKEPCYAFLAKGDITVVCQGRTTQVTHKGDVEHFAASDEQSALAFISGGAGAATFVHLKAGTTKRIPNVDEVVASCGGILPIPVGGTPSVRELATGEELSFAPYRRFRCSSDRKKIVGIASRELYEGVPPATKVAPGTEVHDLYFNISPDGSKIVYYNDVKPLCVFTGAGSKQCVEHETMSDPVSVNDAGEVLAASGTGKGCVYKSAYNYTPAKAPDSGDDECLGVGYWKPGMQAIVFLQEIGRNPQWLRPETAALLVEWSRQTKSR